MSRRRHKKVNGWIVPDATTVDATPRIKKQHQGNSLWNPDNAPPVYEKISRFDFYRSSQWRSLRYQAFKAYGNFCGCCGRSPRNNVVLHVDHILPRSIRPDLSLSLSNLQILCEECNMGKANTDATNWRK